MKLSRGSYQGRYQESAWALSLYTWVPRYRPMPIKISKSWVPLSTGFRENIKWVTKYILLKVLVSIFQYYIFLRFHGFPRISYFQSTKFRGPWPRQKWKCNRMGNFPSWATRLDFGEHNFLRLFLARVLARLIFKNLKSFEHWVNTDCEKLNLLIYGHFIST